VKKFHHLRISFVKLLSFISLKLLTDLQTFGSISYSFYYLSFNTKSFNFIFVFPQILVFPALQIHPLIQQSPSVLS